jgi:GNAT superfamily N-acetyltransferase
MSEFAIRRAQLSDAAVIALHRARMFQEMGDVPPEMFEPLRSGAERWLREAFARGEYVGWLATSASSTEVIAGVGVQLRRVAPHPAKINGKAAIGQGRHAIVINVFTEPAWRRRGLGELLMKEIIEFAKAERLDRLVLHASKHGRGLYERLGFVATNGMRFGGELSVEPSTAPK